MHYKKISTFCCLLPYFTTPFLSHFLLIPFQQAFCPSVHWDYTLPSPMSACFHINSNISVTILTDFSAALDHSALWESLAVLALSYYTLLVFASVLSSYSFAGSFFSGDPNIEKPQRLELGLHFFIYTSGSQCGTHVPQEGRGEFGF